MKGSNGFYETISNFFKYSVRYRLQYKYIILLLIGFVLGFLAKGVSAEDSPLIYIIIGAVLLVYLFQTWMKANRGYYHGIWNPFYEKDRDQRR